MTNPVAAIIPAAGSGQRLGGGQPKALRLIAGEPLLLHTARQLCRHPAITSLAVAVPPEAIDDVTDLLAGLPVAISVVPGGASRQESVARALAATDSQCQIVLVHDAARPLMPLRVIDAVISAVAAGNPAAIPGLPVTDTIKEVGADDVVVRTPARADLRAIQTPQAFRREVLAQAHRLAGETAEATDDAALVESAGYPVLVVPGDPLGFKITHPPDLARAAELLREN